MGGSTPPVFLAPRSDLVGGTVVLSGPEGRHAAAARRLRPGERADLADGEGMLAECVVTSAGPDSVLLSVLSRREVPRLEPLITVVQALPKGDRGELAVETMTEVGVDTIVPWAAARCVARWEGSRGDRALGRWRSAAREAAKQSRRAWIPSVTGLATTAEVSARIAAARGFVLSPGAGLPLTSADLPGSGEIILVVGPEGGLTDAELAAFTASGAAECRLGPTVLRTSTAGAAAAVALLTRTSRW